MTQTVVPRPQIGAIVPGGVGVRGFYLIQLMGGVFPLTAGLLLYGWHGAAVIGGVVGSAALAVLVWRRIGPRGRTLHMAHALWLALLLALMLPAELAIAPAHAAAPWPLIPLAGLLLVILLWLFGGLGGGQVHPIIVTYLMLVICYADLLIPHRVLSRDHLLVGELLRGDQPRSRTVHTESWIERRGASDADIEEPASERLTRYTSGREVPARRWLPLSGLLRDSMPPLEDFIVAGQPGPLGASSVIAVIIGGLFLLYRGMIDYRIPLLTCVSAYASLLLLPIPAVISNGPQWAWAALRLPGIGWSVAITFVNYELMASPLIFTAFFLATAPIIRPMTRRGRTVYALLLGAIAAVLQLYVSVSYGPYVALLIVSLLTPALDQWFTLKPLI